MDYMDLEAQCPKRPLNLITYLLIRNFTIRKNKRLSALLPKIQCNFDINAMFFIVVCTISVILLNRQCAKYII